MPQVKTDPPPARSKDLTLEELVNALANERGPDLRGYKHGTLGRRVEKRMFDLGITTFGQYLEAIRKTPGEIPHLLNTVLINVTEFCRDAPAWEFMRTQVLPKMLKNIKTGDVFRCWSAGCATGE